MVRLWSGSETRLFIYEMFSHRCFVRVSILVAFEYFFRCQCADPPHHQKECYEVGYNTFCFFRPEHEYMFLTWQDAYQTCLRSNAMSTLPAIPSEEAQRAFERYMTFLKLVDRDDFWMAGQEVRELEWKWINGKTELLTGDMRDDYVQGVLTNGMLYRTEIPNNVNHFVCQLHGRACRSDELLSLGEGCLLINNTEALNFYDARNWCVKNGGDLPVIDSPDVLSIFREIVFRMRNAANVWVGLRKQWWTWKNTDSMLEMKYTNWLPNHGFKSNQTCMLAEMKGYRWQQESCSSKKLYVCQTVVTTPLNVISNPFTILTPMSAIVYAALGTFILVVPVIIAVIVTKQRKAKQLQCDARRAPSDRSYQDLHDRQDNQYTELHQKTERTPNYQNLSDYDDTVVTRVPNYLDIIE